MSTESSETLSGIQDDLVNVLALVYGGDRTKGATKLDDLFALLRAQAKQGALEAAPEIRLEVKKEVTPYVYIALGLGVLGVLVGAGAIIYVRRKHG